MSLDTIIAEAELAAGCDALALRRLDAASAELSVIRASFARDVTAGQGESAGSDGASLAGAWALATRGMFRGHACSIYVFA